MKFCPWCNTEYPEEFFEVHHLNHIHEDDSEENRITICVKCHKRHHRESGYDTVIIKKNSFVPKTLMEEMVIIERSVFLQEYRRYAEKKMTNQLGKMYNSPDERYKELLEWIEKDGKIRLDVHDPGFHMMKKVDLVPKQST
jgi:hypothetical protein